MPTCERTRSHNVTGQFNRDMSCFCHQLKVLKVRSGSAETAETVSPGQTQGPAAKKLSPALVAGSNWLTESMSLAIASP